MSLIDVPTSLPAGIRSQGPYDAFKISNDLLTTEISNARCILETLW